MATAIEVRKHPIAATALGALALAIVLTSIISQLPLEDPVQHALLHLGVDIPALLLVLAMLRIWPRPAPDRWSRTARGVLISGIAILGGGMLIEAVGAFGFERSGGTNFLAGVHDFAVWVGVVGQAVTLAGVMMSLVMAIAVQRDAVGSRWTYLALALAGAAPLVFFLGEIVFGY